MMKYKVVKTYDVFFKGDVFTKNEDGTYSCEMIESNNGYKYSSKITVSKQCMLNAIAQGVVEIINDKPVTKESLHLETCANAVEELKSLIKEYRIDLDNNQNDYAKGKISAMEHATALTVLTNLIKLAEHIKNILK